MNYKNLFAIVLVAVFATNTMAQDETKPTETKPAPAAAEQTAGETQEAPQVDEGSTIEKASFLIGFNTITRLKQQGAEFKFEQLLAGLNAANEGRESGMTREEQRSVLVSYQQIVRSRLQAKRQKQAEDNGVEGEKALAEFAKQEGAKELEDGVMYIVVQEGKGEIPEAPDRVKLHYKGTYVGGEEFDASSPDEPLVNGATQFVPGFSAAVQKMKVGSKWKIIVRGDKAYGMRPRPPMEMNKTLMFDIELLEIMPVK